MGSITLTIIAAGAAMTLLGAASTGAQVPPWQRGHGVPASELAGLDPAAVRARLSGAGVPFDWPVAEAFQIATAAGELSFITLGELMTDPALAQRMAAFRTNGDPIPFAPYLKCKEFLVHPGGSPESAASVVLVFRDGRLEAAQQPVAPTNLASPNLSDKKSMAAYIRRPQRSPFVAKFGELPLEDGLGFLSRLTSTALSPADELSSACESPTPPAASSPSRGHALDASDFQGLSLLPFALTLPAKNQQRVAARKSGAALMARLRVGETLAAAPQSFAANHAGVRAYPAKSGDYAVLSIDMGGYPGRNLTNFNDAALVGVRNGRIEWIAPPALFGPSAALLCLDEQGVPSTPRPGCTGWGHFSP